MTKEEAPSDEALALERVVSAVCRFAFANPYPAPAQPFENA